MDIYHIWCDLKAGENDVAFVSHLTAYFEHLKEDAALVNYRVTRRKLGLAPPELMDFHIMLEFENLAELDATFNHVATRKDPVETFHHAVNGRVNNVKFALYRDFPDPVREEGQARF